jgi:hypothetical protein
VEARELGRLPTASRHTRTGPEEDGSGCGQTYEYTGQEDTHPILVFMHILGRVPNRGVTGCSDQAEYSPRVLRLMENWRWRNGGCWCLAGKGERLFRWGIIDAFGSEKGRG